MAKINNPRNAAAFNSKWQATVNRFVKADIKYDGIVDANDAADRDGSPQQSSAYDRASELFHELPKREQQKLNVTGY